MTPRMPKISVSPLATRNSSSPYCTAFRHWTRKTAKSMDHPRKVSLASLARYFARARLPPPSRKRPFDGGAVNGRRDLHLAAGRRLRERLDGDAFELVLRSDDLAQVNVLHRVVRLRQRERAARAVDARLLHR